MKMIVRKLDLYEMIEVLNQLYDMGINYVDLYGESHEYQDSLGFYFSKEYMDPEHAHEFDNLMTDDRDSSSIRKLTDDDINQLL
jgi:hypothetical protein